MIKIEIPEMLVKDDFSTFKDLSNRGGNYIFYHEKTPVYVGKCQSIKTRIYEHMIGATHTSNIFGSFQYVKYFYEDSPLNRDIYETYLINTVQPLFNKNKAFTYKPKYKGMSVSVKKPDRWDRPIKKERCIYTKEDGERCKMYAKVNGYCKKHNKKVTV